MISEQRRISPSIISGKFLTVDDLLKSLQKLKRQHGGAALVVAGVDVELDYKIICRIDSAQSADTPLDSVFKGATIVLFEVKL